VTAGTAPPMTADESVAAVLGRLGTDRRESVAERTKSVANMIVVMRRRAFASVKTVLPMPLDVTLTEMHAVLRQGDLPVEGGSTTVSQPAAAQADAARMPDMEAGDANSQSHILSGPCGTRANHLCLTNRVSAERLGLAAHSASDLTTFLQISSITRPRNSGSLPKPI
jgi:hypothetical protein